MSENIEKKSALLLTENCFFKSGKTAHGLLRRSDRFIIKGVIDSDFGGRDTGDVLHGAPNGIFFFGSIEDYLEKHEKPETLIIGVSTTGGFVPPNFKIIIKKAIQNKINILNILHESLSDDEELVWLANQFNVEIFDLRKPKPSKDLHFWTGKIREVKTPRIAVLGSDCAVGKRTTTNVILRSCREARINTEMIFTGQTGWLQGNKYGFIFDTTLNDFVSGEIEHAIVNCDEKENPDLILIEGQSSFRNPSGPCGSEFILSGEAKYAIFQHIPGRPNYKVSDKYKMVPIQEEIALAKLYGAETIGICINNENLSPEEEEQVKQELEKELNIPVLNPLKDNVSPLIEKIKQII